MRLDSGQPDYSEKISFVIDESASPTDIDAAVAEFLIALYQRPATGEHPNRRAAKASEAKR